MRLTFLVLGVVIAVQLWGQDTPKGVIEGTVVDEVTGEPVRRAAVALTGQRADKTQESAMVQTQADGRFRFEGLEAGNYYVIARRNGYVEMAGRRGIAPFALTASEQKTGMTIKLTPQGIISGRVFDEEGDPVQGAQVQVLQRRRVAGKLRWQPAMGSNTNDRGEYRLPNLTAGEYAVSANYMDPMSPMGNGAQARPQVYATTYYPNGVDLNSAQAVAVQKGGETAGIDLRLRRESAFRVRVRVEGTTPESAQQISVTLMPRDPSEGFGRASGGNRQLGPGLFELVGVRAGSWLVQAQAFPQGGEPLTGVTPIEVTSADLTDVVVRVMAGQQISGTFAFEGTPVVKMNWKQHNVRLVPTEGAGGNFGFAGGRPSVNDDGTFALRNTMPGKYLIDVQGPRPDKTYVASIKIGNDDYFGKELDLTGGAPGPIKITYRNDGAKVSGKLEGEFDGADGKRGVAVLVPVEAYLRRLEYMMTAPVRPDGSFAFGSVRPGEYLAYHVMGDYQVLAENGEAPKESMDAAVRLKVEAGGTQTVQMKVVRAAPEQ